MGYLTAQPLLMNKTVLTDFIVLMAVSRLTRVRSVIPLQTVQMCQTSVRGATCQTDGLSTDKEFIGNVYLRWFTILQCIVIFGLNGKAGVDYVRSEKKN